MAEKRTIELEIQDNSKSLKSQYKAAVAELQKVTAQYGETSKEAVKAAKAAAELKDQITFSKDLVDSFNPDAKFNSLTKSVSGVLDGFQAYEGAMGLIGAENEELQKTMLKVQSAMALSQGIQGVFEAKDAFKQLGTVVKSTAVGQAVLTAATSAYTFVTGAATTGLKLFRAALVSTGIGALVVGVGLLVANFDKVINLFTPLIQGFKDFGDWIGITSFKQDEENKKAVKRADNRIAEINREKAVREKAQKAKENAYNAEDKALGRQIDLMRAQGKDTTALERARLKATINYQANLQNETFAIFNQNKEKNKLTLSELRAIAVRDKDFTEYNKFLLSTSATQNELAAENAAANEARKDAINQLAIFEAEVAKAQNERQSQSVSNTEKTEKEKLDLTRVNTDKQIELMADGYDKQVALAKEKARREQEDLIANSKGKIVNAEQVATAQKLIEDNLTKDLRKLDIQYNSEKVKTLAGGIEYMSSLRGKDLDAEIAISAKKIENAKDEIKQKTDIEKEAINARVQMAKDGLQLVSNITELFGRKNEKSARIAFQVDKAAKLASAGISGVEGTINAYKTAQGSPYTALFPGYPLVQAGLAAAFAATNIAKISQAKFGGSTSQGGGGTGGGGAAPITPQFNTVGNSGINQLAQLQQQPVQAYVVSGEVTSQQSLDRNRAQNSSL